MRDFVTFSSINHVTLFAWVTGRGKGHPGMVNTPRGPGRAKKGSHAFWTAPYVKVTSYMHIRSCYAALIHLYAILKVFALIKLTNFKTRFWTRDTRHVGSEDTM